MPLTIPDGGGDRPHDPRAFLARWAGAVQDALRGQLPDDRFLTELVVRARPETENRIGASDPGLAASFAPPPAVFRAPARFVDRVGVNVLDRQAERDVAAAVVFVSPDHKQDSDAALMLAAQCAAVLSVGAGLVVVDTVPGTQPAWATHLHSLVGVFPVIRRPPGTEMCLLAVRPTVNAGESGFDAWYHRLRPGDTLPTVPLGVRGAGAVRLDLEATYPAAG